MTDRLLTAEELHRPGRVYVLDVDERSAVKIGFSARSVLRRRKALQTGHPLRLRVVWQGPGTPLDEAGIHQLLAPSRLEGEWFARTDIVRMALAMLPIYGAHWVGKLETNMLETFVPTMECGVPFWYRIGPLAPGTSFWPRWRTSPAR